MKSQGSVLIVVLGLLAILAIVGVTFVTMSSMDRSTASNFAIQSQFMLAADGAVDYVCDHLIKDLWQFNPWAVKSGDPLIPSDDPYMTGTPLLTDLRDFVDPRNANFTAPRSFATLRVSSPKYCAFIRNEPWDAPGAFPPNAVPGPTGLPEDPWLATTLDMRTLVDLANAEKSGSQDLTDPLGLQVKFAYSYGYYLGPKTLNFPAAPLGTTIQPYPYALGCWWLNARVPTDVTNRANNLGIPGGLALENNTVSFDLTKPVQARHVDPYWPPSGVWIPDLSFPYESGIIRVSVTVQDHNALLNANIHENRAGGLFTRDPISGATGRGYFVSDVAFVRDTCGIDPNFLLNGTTVGTRKIPGRWPRNEQTGQAKCPTNPSLMQTEIENPTGGSLVLSEDRPFTLEEEFELRRYLGTSYRSRLEAMGGTAIDLDPSLDPSLVTNLKDRIARRMALTTVGWTSEVRPDPHVYKDPPAATGTNAVAVNHQVSPAAGSFSAHKADVNLGVGGVSDAEDVQYIFRSLWYAHCFDESIQLKTAQVRQFVANIDGFRNGSNQSGILAYNPTISIGTAAVATDTCVAASRQPIIDKISFTSTPDTDPNNPNGKIYTVKVELLSPWEGNCVGDGTNVGDGTGLSYPAGCNLVVAGGATPAGTGLGGRMTNRDMSGLRVGINCYDLKATVPQGGHLSTFLSGLRLTAQPPPPPGSVSPTIVLDEALMGTPGLNLFDSMENEASGAIGRPIYIAYDPGDMLGDYRGSNNNKGLNGSNPVRVVYIDDWKKLTAGKPGYEPNTWAQPDRPADPASLIPIRFPRSCHKSRYLPKATDYKGLPPIATQTCTGPTATEGTFKAIPRLGDLCQILWWDGTSTFWPWTNRVIKKQVTRATGLFPGAVAADSNYMDPTLYWKMTSYPRLTDYNILNFPNALCTGGPWLDGFDNDGDGTKDEIQFLTETVHTDIGEKDKITGTYGRLFGPELRVAGKINLNTATQDTLQALETGVGVTGLWDAVKKARQTMRILTPAFLLDFNSYAWYSPTGFTITTDPTGTLTGIEDKRREAYARISNIVTIRSDTFSIYGTVQYVDASGYKRKAAASLMPYVKRTRRFWALVDRSPTAAFSPGETSKFIRPRVMNFQWMD